jgi:hypothetical protein
MIGFPVYDGRKVDVFGQKCPWTWRSRSVERPTDEPQQPKATRLYHHAGFSRVSDTMGKFSVKSQFRIPDALLSASGKQPNQRQQKRGPRDGLHFCARKGLQNG